MRLQIRHHTEHVYDHAVPYSIQILRLTPRPHAGLRIVDWRVTSEPRPTLAHRRDAFGNVEHVQVVRTPHTHLAVVADGVVETCDTASIIHDPAEPFPPCFYLRTTPLTAPEPALAALAAAGAAARAPLARLRRLQHLVHERVAHRSGATDVHTSAAAALRRGAGVSRDHVHVFIAAARLLGIPARYVGGYLGADGRSMTGAAGHAWAEAHVADLGWVGFDPAAGTCPHERHVRCNVGLDHLDAAPVRRVQVPGEREDSTVRVAVAEMQQQ